MSMTLAAIEPDDDRVWLVFDDDGVTRRADVGAKGVWKLLALASEVIGPVGRIRAQAVLLDRPRRADQPVTIGIRSELLGDVWFDLPWDQLRGLADIADEALRRVPPDGSA